MGLLSTLLGILGLGIGIPVGLFIGFYLFIYSQPDKDIQEPTIRQLNELDKTYLEDLLPEIPLWVKCPDYDRVDWLNKFLLEMWPYLDKAICEIIRSTLKPIFADYIGQYMLESIEFDNLTLGTLPPIIQGIKVFETNESELVMEPAIKWAGNPNIIVVIKIMSMPIKIQLVDMQIFASPRITLKPLLPSFPCFANSVVSLLEKPHVDFGLKVLGGDIMSIPGVYRFIQETIKKQVSSLYLWPQTLEIPILDASSVAAKKPVGILHVRVVKANKLLKKDLLGLSDPYVKLSLSGDKLPSKKTTIKKKTLNPEWNENFKIAVKDPNLQLLHICVYDWDKVGGHDRLGTQLLPLKELVPNEKREFTLDLIKDTNVSEPEKKPRGHITLEVTYAPFRDNDNEFSGTLEELQTGSFNKVVPRNISTNGIDGGLLLVIVYGAKNVEGRFHNNPYTLVVFRGEIRKSKMVKKSRDPNWNEEFQFVLEEPPINDKIRIEVMSKRTTFSLRSKKESLGYVDINLTDVVYNGRMNHKYNLIDSKNGVIHIELGWNKG
ncbi:synaptotagmin-3-like [Impatiens glandulifera]|uniref:synaptotagmin-3-like n=1 Tax=Impatiens glandulifera TaxID=253017 RepID=UPI001FB05ABB|nr:synaptotagmin-3-like [Impatiens glandulifera]